MYKKELDSWIEVRIIPETEEIIRRLSLEQFDKEITDLTTEIANFKPIEFGTIAKANRQAKLDEMLSAKIEVEK